MKSENEAFVRCFLQFQSLKIGYLRLLDAKRNSITHAGAATMKLNGAIPLRSADIQVQSTKEWQHTAVQYIL